jgi:hypothetical protein
MAFNRLQPYTAAPERRTRTRVHPTRCPTPSPVLLQLPTYRLPPTTRHAMPSHAHRHLHRNGIRARYESSGTTTVGVHPTPPHSSRDTAHPGFLAAHAPIEREPTPRALASTSTQPHCPSPQTLSTSPTADRFDRTHPVSSACASRRPPAQSPNRSPGRFLPARCPIPRCHTAPQHRRPPSAHAAPRTARNRAAS